MKRTKQIKNHPNTVGFDHSPANDEFYTGSPAEKPLYQEQVTAHNDRVKKTTRHKAVSGRRKETGDIRDKNALIGILKMAALLIFLLIAFFLLKEGIFIYKENLAIKKLASSLESSPVLSDVSAVPDFDIATQNEGEAFAERIATWREVERLVSSAESLWQRNNYDAAIDLSEQALRLDAFHMGALDALGKLYFEKGMMAESINAYIRALSVEPSREDLQLGLINALDAFGDADATIAAAQWYQDVNVYSEAVQRAVANAYFDQEKYAESAAAYDRLLKDVPRDATALERQALSYMQLEQYEEALETWNRLHIIQPRDPLCLKRIAICYAQLGKSQEVVETLSMSAHLFGQNTVMTWVQDPQMASILGDPTFSRYVERIGGEEFRVHLETVARQMNLDVDQGIQPQLSTSAEEDKISDLLNKDD